MHSIFLPPKTQRMIGRLIAFAVLIAPSLSPAVAQPADDTSANPQVERRRGRLTPELIKRYDKNSDGMLDQVERAAARADLAGARPAGTSPRSPVAGGAAKASIGQKPLTEMGAEERVRGQEGGLYGNGMNEPPAALRTAADTELAQIKPRDVAGRLAPDGKVVLLSIGMSNTTREFTPFKEQADADPRKSPNLVIVDGALGGQGAAEWCSDDGKPVWKLAEQRIRQAGASPEQVQVVWLKQAIKRPLADSIENAQQLRSYLTSIVQTAKKRYPNLRIVYLSSRTFGGYSERHGETESFDTAFAVRWVIQDQQAGKSELNWDPARGAVRAPLLVWGPYLWADGEVPRSDGLTWLRNDFVPDGTHPSSSGQKKVVDLLMKYFTTDPLAASWFVK